MRTFFTTEENLIKILHSKDTNVWKKILYLHDIVFVSSPSGEWDRNNKTLQAFHRSGKKIFSYNDFFDIINVNPSRILSLSQPTLLLNIKKDKADALRNDFGVCCYSLDSKIKPFYTENGWEVETTDPDIIKSWTYFYDGFNKCCNSILIIDRYLFASQWNKGSKCPDDNIQDTYDNLVEILNNILPDSITTDILVVSIIFDSTTITNSGKNQRSIPSFQDIALKMEQIRSSINRPYDFGIELISVQNNCAFYNETHDRFIITNYSITEATHKIKAYNNKGESIDSQKLYFNYSYSKGIAPNDKSSAPARTQDRVLDAMRQLLLSPQNFSLIQYAFNGSIKNYTEGTLQNRILASKV